MRERERVRERESERYYFGLNLLVKSYKITTGNWVRTLTKQDFLLHLRDIMKTKVVHFKRKEITVYNSTTLACPLRLFFF